MKNSIYFTYANGELYGWISVVLFHKQYSRSALTGDCFPITEHYFSLTKKALFLVLINIVCDVPSEILKREELPLWDIFPLIKSRAWH